MTQAQWDLNPNFTQLMAKTGMFWVNLMSGNGYGGIKVEWKQIRVQSLYCLQRPWADRVSCKFRTFRRYDDRILKIVPYLRWGTQWVALSRPFCNWLMKASLARNCSLPPPSPHLKFSNLCAPLSGLLVAANIEIPDETYFQTLAYMSDWRDHSIWEPATFPMPIRAEHWSLFANSPDSLSMTQLKDILSGVRITAPETYVEDFRHNMSTYFARKLDPSHDEQYNFIDQHLYGKVIFTGDQPRVSTDDTWWWS